MTNIFHIFIDPIGVILKESLTLHQQRVTNIVGGMLDDWQLKHPRKRSDVVIQKWSHVVGLTHAHEHDIRSHFKWVHAASCIERHSPHDSRFPFFIPCRICDDASVYYMSRWCQGYWIPTQPPPERAPFWGITSTGAQKNITSSHPSSCCWAWGSSSSLMSSRASSVGVGVAEGRATIELTGAGEYSGGGGGTPSNPSKPSLVGVFAIFSMSDQFHLIGNCLVSIVRSLIFGSTERQWPWASCQMIETIETLKFDFLNIQTAFEKTYALTIQ